VAAERGAFRAFYLATGMSQRTLVREASRAHAPDSPMPGEHRGASHATRASAGAHWPDRSGAGTAEGKRCERPGRRRSIWRDLGPQHLTRVEQNHSVVE
jgi:ribosomal protein S14